VKDLRKNTQRVAKGLPLLFLQKTALPKCNATEWC